MLHEMISFVLQKDAGLTKARARTVASYFADLESFQNLTRNDLRQIRGIGRRRTIRLRDNEIESVMNVKEQNYIDPTKSIAENFLAAISREFTTRQLTMIRAIDLEKLNPNPFLINALNLRTPEEVVRLNVYMVATRSIVTSMGYFVEKLLLASSDDVEKGERGTGWDIVKTDTENRHWIQVKSGPNDMDKDQVVYWSKKIEEKLEDGDKAYIGITYGKRTNETVTIGLMRQLLPDWEITTLIGRELWDFISGDEEYHNRLFDTLRHSAHAVLTNTTICREIESCINRMEQSFVENYGEGIQGVSNYLNAIF